MEIQKRKVQVNKPKTFDPDMEQRMRLIANLIIDRIFEDKRNNKLKFQRK